MDNQVYYYEIGEGRWAGRFDFRMTDWPAFFAARMGPKDRLLAVALDLVGRLPGAAKMQAEIRCDPAEASGVARIEVSVRRFGFEIYRLRGHYALAPDGHGVEIHIEHRYGPHGMPWATKAGAAQISEGGWRADYDMRLLGQSATGVYRIDDPMKLEARYDLGWGECKETMHRAGPRKPARRRPRARCTALLDAARELERLERRFDAAQSPLAPFCHVYAYFVRDLAFHLEDHDFEDPDWVVRLARAFVLLFVEAVRGEAAAGIWGALVDQLDGPRFTALEELALGVLVHIGHDLPHALRAVGLMHPDGRPRIHDFHLVNTQLSQAIAPVQVRLSNRYTPLAGALDDLLGAQDEALALEAIQALRAQAWYEAGRLSHPEARAEAQRDMEARIQGAIEALRGRAPGARITRAGLRRLVRPLRRWPRHPCPEAPDRGPEPRRGWYDTLIGARVALGHSSGRDRPAAWQAFLTSPNALLGDRGRRRLEEILSNPAAPYRDAPAPVRLTLAGEAAGLEDHAAALEALGVSKGEAQAARRAQSDLVSALRGGFDAAQAELQALIARLDGLGLPASRVIAALDDETSGYDPETDTFVARAAALFEHPLEALAEIVDPARWGDVIGHVEDAYWIEVDAQGDLRRGRVYERVNVLAPWIEHHPMVIEAELAVTHQRSEARARVDYRLARSLDGSLDVDEGFIEARRVDEAHTAVLIDKRLRVVDHALLYALLRAYPDGLAALLTYWIHEAARS